MSLWIFVSVALALLGVFEFHRYSKRRSVRKLLELRSDLDLDQIYEQYYSATTISRVRFEELWSEVATALDIPPSKLRPEDNLHALAADGPLTSERLDALTGLGVRRAKAEGFVPNLQSIKTVNDYVRLAPSVHH